MKPSTVATRAGRRMRHAFARRALRQRELRENAGGRAVRRAWSRSLTAEERAVVDPIERRRRDLEQSEATVSISIPAESVESYQARVGKEPGLGLRGLEVTRRVDQATLRTSKPQAWGEFLFRLVRELQPERILELGTSVGLSGAYQAAALELNGHGELVTIEGSAEIARVARETFDALDLKAEIIPGYFDEVLDGVLEDGVSLAFVDGNHRKTATLRYAELIRNARRDPGVVVYDDIDWSREMRSAWKQLSSDPDVIAVDLGGVGLTVPR